MGWREVHGAVPSWKPHVGKRGGFVGVISEDVGRGKGIDEDVK